MSPARIRPTVRHLKLIRKVHERVSGEISDFAGNRGTGPEGKFARGLASEGYQGGYTQALRDVLLLMESDCLPNTRGWWDGLELKSGEREIG